MAESQKTNGNTVEPPVSHHPKDLVVAYGKWSLTGGGRSYKNRTTGRLFRKAVRAHILCGR